MPKRFLKLGSAIVLALVAGHGKIQADPIEVQSPVYDFLRRGEAMGLVPLGFTSTLPKDRREILAALQSLEAQTSDTWMKQSADRFRSELDWAERQNRSRLIYRDSNAVGGAQVDYLTEGAWQDSLPRPQGYAFGSFAVGVAGTYRDRIYLLSQAFLGQERSRVDRFRENYNAGEGMPYNTDREGKAGIARGVSTFDGFRTVMGYGDGHARVELGQDWNAWGPGVFQHATLGARPWFWVQDSLPASDSVGYAGTVHPGGYRRGYRNSGEAAPLPQGRLTLQVGSLEYTKVVAQRTGLDTDSAAWLIAHRLVWRALPKLAIGATEMVALAGRSPDLVYMIPLVPLKYAEHELGDRDNIALSLDVNAVLPGRVRAYGEILLDDYSGFPLDFWGNKLAFTLGANVIDPGLSRTDFTVEASQVGPWLFSHHHRDTQMQSYGALLGSSLPPDSRSLRLQAIHHWNAAWDWNVDYAYLERSVGVREASLFSVHIDSLDGNRTRLLHDRVEMRHAWTASATWRPTRYLTLFGLLGGLWVKDWKGEIGLDLASPLAEGRLVISY